MKEAIDMKRLDRVIEETLIEAKRVKTGTLRKSLQADKAIADLRERLKRAPKIETHLGLEELEALKNLLETGVLPLVKLDDGDKMPDLIAKQSIRRREVIEEALDLIDEICPPEPAPAPPFMLQGSEVK